MSIRVVVVDDQALIRSGFRVLIDAQPDLEVVGEAADGHEAIETILRARPDVALMDIRMPRLDGIEATRTLARMVPDTKVVILTTYDLDDYVFESLRAGAVGFLLKDARADQLVDGIRSVVNGGALLAPQVTMRMIREFSRRPADQARTGLLERLTTREAEVFTLVAHGLSNREIARQLVISEPTTKTHVARILHKLDLRDRVQAVVLAYETGIVRAGPS